MDINVMIINGFVQYGDLEQLYGDEQVTVYNTSHVSNLTDLVFELGLFPSKSQARKAGRTGPIPTGWNVFKGNKKTFIYLWNPTE